MNANTPIAKALLGAEVGDVVVVCLPAGTARLKIVDIR
jgi:transcription elongation GreA/GreB family factor